VNDRRGFWVRWRVPLAYPFAVIGFWLARPTPASIIWGSTIAIAGLIVRGAAAGIVHKGEQLATSGIYAWTRNPLYLGSTIMAVGFGVAAYSWIVVALVAAYLAVFYPVVIRREEVNLRERFGAEFDAYTARVSVFFPWPAAQPAIRPEYSWSQFIRNHEYRAAAGAIMAIGLLALRMWMRK
jgi:protein-S-isoprenylcysteine O-methyltransferase Ste14